VETKICSKCKEVLPIEKFYKGKTQCKKCRIEHSKKYYQKNRDKILERSRKCRESNKDKISKFSNDTTKICSKCKKLFPIEEFLKKKSQCKKCRREYWKKLYRKKRDKYKERREKQNQQRKQQRKWDRDNATTKICSKCKELLIVEEFSKGRNSCKKCRNRLQKEYYQQNKYKAREYSVEYYHRHKKEKEEYDKKYRQNNKDKIRRDVREYEKKRALNDPRFKLNSRIRCSIRNSLKLGKNGRHWEDLVGYDLDKLIQRLEVNFKSGMSWSNYGEWHIDHKKPISLFNFLSFKDKEFKCCWMLCNLQPLWAKENFSKRNKFKG